MTKNGDMCVLYVEDEPLARWTGAKIIEPLVGRLMVAGSCAEAADLWRREKIDLVITDYRLEDGLATELVQRMRAAGFRTPVICLSGEAENLAQTSGSEPHAGFVAVLSKPLDREALAGALAGVKPLQTEAGPDGPGTDAGSSPAEAAAVVLQPSLLWVAPDWDLIATNDDVCGFELAAGRKGGVWALVFENSIDAGRAAQGAALLRLMFRQLAAGLPSGATAGRMLDHCRRDLRRWVDPDTAWSLVVLHLQEGRMTWARNAAPGNWNFWYQDAQSQWRALTDWSSERRACLALGCMAALLPAESGGGADPRVVAGRLAAGRNGEPVDGQARGFSLLAGAGGRCIDLAPPCPEALVSSGFLPRLEKSLLADGLDPMAVRRLACGLLDVLETQTPPSLRLEWSARRISMTLPNSVNLPEHGFFDVVTRAGHELCAAVTVKAADARHNPAARRISPDGDAAAAAGFARMALPEMLTSGLARELKADRPAPHGWALDGRRLRYFSSGALQALCAAADAVRAAGAGVVCLVGCSPLVEDVLRSVGMERNIDLAPDFAALAALTRRLTSMSERASILESVVKW